MNLSMRLSLLSTKILFFLGVGDNVDHKELSAIASSPAEQNVFQVESYSALKYIKVMLAIETCKGKVFLVM